jgi:hypothetical protein
MRLDPLKPIAALADARHWGTMPLSLTWQAVPGRAEPYPLC